MVEVSNGSYGHVFEWDDSAEITCSVAEGDYLIVSSETRPAVAAGPVRIVALKQLTLHLERYCTWKNYHYVTFSKSFYYLHSMGVKIPFDVISTLSGKDACFAYKFISLCGVVHSLIALWRSNC